MRWLLLSLVTPLIVLAGLVGQPIKPAPTQMTPTPVTVRVPVAPTPTVLIQPDGVLEQIVSVARSWLGVPYRWGGCARSGTDCSCFVRNVLLAIGINAPRTTVEQVRWARPVGRGDLGTGDLIFFDDTCTGCGANPTHVGIYLSAGVMAEAGDPVQLASIDSPFWRSHYASAGRPPGL
jgi:probable lipoprotein NlpC